MVTALGLLAFLAYWSGQRVLIGEDGQSQMLAAVSGMGLALGFPYLAWFIRKSKNLG